MITDLECICDWFIANKLTMNLNKTNLCHFRPPNMPEIDPILLRNVTVEIKDCVKYLGLLIDRQLTWKDHVANITSRLNQQLGVLRHARKHLNRPALKTIYCSLSLHHHLWPRDLGLCQ